MGDLQELAPNTLVGNGRYRVGEEINRGGTAVVYVGFDNALAMRVALKVMNVAPDSTIAVPLKSVKREIKYASKLGARAAQGDLNVVRLLNVVQEGQGILILVWELVKGMDVLDYMNSLGGVMPEHTARVYFKQLLDGIRCIHAHGFCHRDIKPENAIVEADTGILKIIDFGLSKHLDSARTVGIGTPDYMAPEILGRSGNPGGGASGDPNSGTYETGAYDPESVDVWAMGVMLYLLLTGTYPFEDRTRPGNVTATLRRVREGKINPFPDRVHPDARDLVKAMIRVDPRRRAKLSEVAQHGWLRGVDGGVGAGGGSGGGHSNQQHGNESQHGNLDAAPAEAHTPNRGTFARRVTGFLSGIFGKGKD